MVTPNPFITSGMLWTAAASTALKGIGSVARIADFKDASNDLLMRKTAQEGLVLAITFVTALFSSRVIKSVLPAINSALNISLTSKVANFAATAIAYSSAEWLSRRLTRIGSGMQQVFERTPNPSLQSVTTPKGFTAHSLAPPHNTNMDFAAMNRWSRPVMPATPVLPQQNPFAYSYGNYAYRNSGVVPTTMLWR